MVPMSRGRELLESAVSYALAGAALGTPQLLHRPTPCPGWDLVALLNHVSDSIGVLYEAITAGDAGASAAPRVTRGRELTRLRACVARQPCCWTPTPLPGQPSSGSPFGAAS